MAAFPKGEAAIFFVNEAHEAERDRGRTKPWKLFGGVSREAVGGGSRD